MQKATAAIFDATRRSFRLQEMPKPEVNGTEILVRNEYVTLCRSDLKTYRGERQEKNPTILGHEVCGRIEAFGPEAAREDEEGQRLVRGDRITWAVFASSPEDPSALEGRPQKAKDLFKYGHEQHQPGCSWHGGLAEYTLLRPNSIIVKVPEVISLPVAAMLNCAAATMAGAMRLAGSVEGKRVLITGAGALGLMGCAMSATAGAAHITAVDPHEHRRNMALRFGAQWAAAPGQMTEQADVVLETSGSPEAMEATAALLQTGGRAVWVGAVFPQRAVQLDAESLIRGLHTIKGLHNYNRQDLLQAVGFVGAHFHHFPFAELVEAEFGLTQVGAAFAYAVEQRPLRTGIKI